MQEANDLLPVVRPLLIDLRDAKERVETARTELATFTATMRANGHGVKAVHLEHEIVAILDQMTETIDAVVKLGIELKDIGSGLIDFPSLREGRIVYLCWRLGEDAIAFWHEVDVGFAGREPL